MAEEKMPLDSNDVAQMRLLAADYEARLTNAASLVARVRHEINNPLTALLGQAQLLLREELSQRSRGRAETIERLALRIKEIVDGLREVQKPPTNLNQTKE